VAENNEENSQSNEEEQNGSSSNEEANSNEELNLADEAGDAAAGKTPPKKDNRSLDDIELSDAQKASVDSYVNKAINDAVAKHDKRSQRKAKDAGTMTRDEVNTLLEERDATNTRRIEARERFLSVLGENGVTPGSEGYKAVQKAYKDGVDDGDFTPQILTSDAGVRTLVALAGLTKGNDDAAGPRSGMSKNLPDTAIIGQDGSIQLNAKSKDDGLSTAERARRDMAASIRNQ